jgi:FAD/FMN-containing dehydrogenase
MIQEKLAQVVGAGNVDFQKSTLDSYSRDMSFIKPIKPAAVVKIRSLDDVQNLVKLAKETGTPLVPVSSGAPHFRGDTVPTTGGAVIVDLSGLKKVIHISRKERMAMFEPGVTFAELKNAISKEGLRMNMPLSPRSTKSVLGSLLEREPVTMPVYHWDIGDPTGCYEIIWGNGEMFRTGAAAGSGTIEEQWKAGGSQLEAAGPSSSSWYRLIQGSQGTMGIVTWGTCRLEIQPKIEKPYFIGSNSLKKMTDAMHWLIRLRLANECFLLNNINAAALMSKSPSEFLAIKDSLPLWVLFFNMAAYNYFPEERMKGQTQDMTKNLQRIGLDPVTSLGRIASDAFLNMAQQPSDDPYWKLRQKGACEDIFFITIYKNLDNLIKTMYETSDSAGFPAANIGIYLQPIVQGVNCHCEFNLFYDPHNAEERERVERLSTIATKKLMDQGAFFSRPYGINTNMIMNRDYSTVNSLKKIKNITDPNGIMNPGKLCF